MRPCNVGMPLHLCGLQTGSVNFIPLETLWWCLAFETGQTSSNHDDNDNLEGGGNNNEQE